MKILNEEKGITLVALVITVIVLAIILGVSVIAGTDLINVSKAETIETNMLTIKAKAKEYMENVDSLNWATSQDKKEEKNQKELTGEKYQLTLIENVTSYSNYLRWYEEGYTYYVLEQRAFEKMNLLELYDEEKTYIIRYPTEPKNKKPSEDLELDIIYENGIKYEKATFFNLSKLQKVL